MPPSEKLNNLTYIAFDPGETTGYAVAEIDISGYSYCGFWLKECGEITWGERNSSIDLVLRLHSPQVIIVESFRLYAHKSTDQINNTFPSVRIIGCIEQAAHQYGLSLPLIEQSAALRKRVRILDEHKSMITSNHVRDAYQHLRYCIVMDIKKRKGK